ncbi:MAG: esterase [Hydrogenophilales bacterium CG03_land_8_20_14_0_80_62_28]|nr:esterase [Betaproteobacteria bacterium]OIO77835.1 MAG: esterase [Hydrogenophilaceae bacterium CG1_02_62_390]PIV23764.1 MAG: esterase [Hydrogenophilales bacterium CG03_land_8_20_14_0_80_62_28]PIW38127.1 MAG: esterase [Hydrogenophilales bacterium CG15_BIG_FIL_POST_REV_8_21_14_020_62_31]PIW72521.1 MAG: esterase [Hydrogenophilales bacterium CG12_big_fil_rev_8_21_14_0_65_61_21]PIX02740.1 MAG: esterase [Hydrogenophilales bacterium CG_4_8_14_3_um_filter_62_83]PIY98394.1 MAG: esterase [Hydrogenoph
MLIYIHGFNSSSQSGKARELAAWMAARGLAEAFVCPDLPPRPVKAIAWLEGLIAASRGTAKLAGSSLGGYYAAWLAEKHGLKAVFINPCVGCDTKLASEVGKAQKNWHDGEEYIFTEQHVAELAALRVERLSRPENYLLLVEVGDEVLDYREAVAYFAGAKQIVLPGGDHGFSRFTDYIPTLLEF